MGNFGKVSAASLVVDQGPHDPALQSRNSNTNLNNPSDQQVADDFTVAGSGLEVNRLELWFTYRDLIVDQISRVAPPIQNLLVRIFGDDPIGDPDALVYEESGSFVPIPTGDENGFLSPNEIFYASIELLSPFQPEDGERYWLSPIGSDDNVTWQWQLSGSEGERRSRGGAGGPDWRGTALDNVTPLTGDFAFRLYAVPEPASLFLLGSFVVLCGVRCSRQRRA